MGNPLLSSGTLFANRFEIEFAAGSGGMGTVYRARDRYSGDLVALKLLHNEEEGSQEVERFSREAQILAELRHPAIVAHVAHGQTLEGQRFLAMEWLEGHDLAQRLGHGPLQMAEALLVIRRIAEALTTAHRRGIVHRDLKPHNIFLPCGELAACKLLDFGIARRSAPSMAMTRTGILVGTPEYMAPEQVRGARELSPAADIFSLGCVLYQCLAGESPFIAAHIAAVLMRILFDEPTPIESRRPGITNGVISLLSDMLNKDPALRIADAAALIARLDTLGIIPDLPTLDAPVKPLHAFAENEQVLFSMVVAAAPKVVGSLASTLGAYDVQADVAQRAALLSATRALGVRAEYLIDGTLVVTIVQAGSAQDQAAMAARVALLIKERWPQASVAVTTGRGTAQGGTAVGEVADRAVQILQRRTGEHLSENSLSGVWLDDLSARLLGPRFALTQRAEGTLLLGTEKEVDESRPLLGKPTPCVGRDAELGILDAHLTSCIEESEAGAVLILASPGVGKSRLRHEFLRRVAKREESITVLLGRGDMMCAGAPYGILSDAIQRLCGLGGGEPADSQRDKLWARIAKHVRAADQERVVLFVGELCKIPFPEEGRPMLQAARRDPKLMRDGLRHALLDWLAAECASGPLLLCLDDLQWGDELTVSVLDQALRDLAGKPLFILSFARPEIQETFPKLWQTHKSQEILLKGLSRKASERLIRQVLGENVTPEAVTRAVEQSAGNALFLEEIIRTLAEGQVAEQPETILAMLQARIGRIHPDARRMVRAASVYGQTFWDGGIATIFRLPRTDSLFQAGLSALIDTELMHRHPSSRLANEQEYGFRHALIREAAYSLLTETDLTTGHRLAGEFLEASGEKDSAAIAEHFERSGDKIRAASFYSQAAEDGLTRGNYLTALGHVDRGLPCAPDGELLGQLRSAEGFLAIVLNRTDRLQNSDEALRYLRPGSLAWCRATMPALTGAMARREAARGSELLSLLLNIEPEDEARTTYVEALVLVVAFLSLQAPSVILHAVLQKMAKIVAQAEAGDPTVRRSLHGSLALMKQYREPGPWSLVKECQRAIELYEQAGDRRLALGSRGGILEWGWLDLGDRAGAEQRLSALAAAMEQSQDQFSVVHWRRLFAQVLCMSDDKAAWERAEQVVAPLRVRTTGFGVYPLYAQGIQATVSLLRGHLREAEEQARKLMRSFPVVPILGAFVAPVLIHSLLGLGQAGEATAIAEQVLSVIPMLGGLGVSEVEFRLSASVAFHTAGNRERAHAELRETLRQIQLRADDIPDPFWKQSYLTRNPYCSRAQKLGQEWGLDVVIT